MAWSCTRKNQFPPQATSPRTSPYPGTFDGNVGRAAITCDIVDRDLAVIMQDCAHGADRRFDLVLSGSDAVHVGQSCNKANRAVTAHAKVANIVKENDTGGARGIDRIAEQSAYDDVGATRLIHYCRPEMVVLVAETFQPVG